MDNGQGGSRLQGCSGDRYSWSPQDLKQNLLEGLAQFICDSGSKACSVTNTPSLNCFLSQEDRDSLCRNINQYVEGYLNYHTHSHNTYKPAHHPLSRYLDQKEEDPWVPGQTGPLGPTESIHQAAKDAEGSSWMVADFSMGLTTTTQERSHSAYIQQKVGTFDRVIKEGGVAGLNRDSPASRSDISRARSGNGAGSISPKQQRSTRYLDGNTSKTETGRRRSKLLGNKALSVNQTVTGHKHSTSGGSKGSSARREPKQHKCPDCNVTYQFEARLKSHQAVHSKQKWRCENCDSEFGRESSLKRHQSTPNACQKKKDAKLRHTSFQNSVRSRPDNQNCFVGVAASMASESSYRESEGVSVDNSPHNTRYPPRFLQSSSLIDHVTTNPGPHEQNEFRDTRTLAYYPHLSHMGNHSVPHWEGIETMLWSGNDNLRGPEFDQFLSYGNE